MNESLPIRHIPRAGLTVPSPKYSGPLSRIYATATVECFTNDSSMESIHHVPSDSRRAGLPSWAVDRGDPAWPSIDVRVTVTRKPIRASGPSASRLGFSEATVRIEVQGSVVDSVRQVGQPPSMKGRLLLAIARGLFGTALLGKRRISETLLYYR